MKACKSHRALSDNGEQSQRSRNDGYIESFTREWGTPQKLGYDGDGIAAKTMNTHIHVLEAYTALYKVWKDNSLCKRLAK